MGNRKRIITLLVFLVGIFMGAIDSGIVSPSRVIIQNGFGISENLGVWMITIYTLVYAVSMPIVSKLSDRYGRKKVYLVSIVIFTIGSALCGLTNFYGSYTLLLGARVIQAIGGGGIVPIATAFIGRSFPEEKRGTAMGLVGAIYGVATMLGPTIGSSIINIAGASNWGWIFFVNVPIGLLIIALGFSLEENLGDSSKKLDIMGSIFVSIVVLSLMYALTNIDFFDFGNSIKSLNVWPFLIIFAVVLPVFVLVELKAEDPVLNVRYFKSFQITNTMFLAFLTGVGLMGVVFIPQFAENVLKLPTGDGGYMVTVMSVFAGVAAPVGGKIIDRLSARVVTIIGFSCTVLGTGFLGLFAAVHPSFGATLFGLAFVGFGMGFTMGTPLNYLMLSYVPQSESASGLAAISLLRSFGVTISPSIMVGFIAQAGKDIQGKLMTYVQDIAPPVPGFDISKMKMTGSGISGDVFEKLKSSDVTTVVNNLKEATGSFLDSSLFPMIKNKITESMSKAAGGPSAGKGAMPKLNIDETLASWKASYLNVIEAKRLVIENLFQSTLNQGFRNMFIATAVIAAVGVVGAVLLKRVKKDGGGGVLK